MGVLCITYKKKIAQNTGEGIFGDFDVTDRKGTWRKLFCGETGCTSLRNFRVTSFCVWVMTLQLLLLETHFHTWSVCQKGNFLYNFILREIYTFSSNNRGLLSKY
jgi:hypothetical protein